MTYALRTVIFTPMATRKQESRIPSKSVRLELFDIQGHHGNLPLDYINFFSFIHDQESRTRQEKVADKVIAVPVFRELGERYAFIAYWGSTDRSFLVFDTETQSEEVRQIEDGKILATRTVGIIDPIRRHLALQYVHTGVHASQIAVFFEKLARERSAAFSRASLEFAPVAGASFRQRLADMDRIQSAALTLTRPNYDWGDYSDQLSNLAGDSQAQRIEVSALAQPKQSLSKNRGVVQLISKLAEGSRHIMKTANVIGFREGDSAPITLNLNKHIEARSVQIPLTPDGLPSPPALIEAGSALLDERSVAQ